MKCNLLLLACALGCALAGCGDMTQPHGTPADVNGMWVEDFGPTLAPGNSFSIFLRDSGSVVSGNGSFAGEAGPYGLLTIFGSAVTDSVHLNIVYEPNASVFPQLQPDTAHFDGMLTTADRIDGVMVRAGALQRTFSLVRLRNDPP